MDEGVIARLAQLLQGGNKFGGATFGGQKFGGARPGGNEFGMSGQVKSAGMPMAGGMAGGGPMAQFAPPPGAADFAKLASMQAAGAAQPQPVQTMPPTTVTAAAPPAASTGPTQPPPQAQGMDMSGYAALATPQAMGAPGMVQMPQTEDQLAQWRKLMDAMQFARQGA